VIVSFNPFTTFLDTTWFCSLFRTVDRHHFLLIHPFVLKLTHLPPPATTFGSVDFFGVPRGYAHSCGLHPRTTYHPHATFWRAFAPHPQGVGCSLPGRYWCRISRTLLPMPRTAGGLDAPDLPHHAHVGFRGRIRMDAIRCNNILRCQPTDTFVADC